MPSPLARRPVAALGVWTAFLWVTRIKNAVGDDTISSGGRAIAIVTSLVFLLAAAVVVVRTWRAAAGWGRLASAFAVVSIGYWVVRAVTIVVRDHPLGFTVVHVALALVTVGLSLLVLRATQRPGSRRAGSSQPVTAG